MTDFEGGLFDRFVFDSFALHVKTGLTGLGWLGSPGSGKPQFTFRTSPVDDLESVPPNTIAVSFETVDQYPGEIGSNLAELSTPAWVDIYTDTLDPHGYSVARHIGGDVREMLSGRMSGIGYTEAGFPVYDFRHVPPAVPGDPPPPPVQIGWCELEHVTQEQSPDAPRHKRHWVAIAATVTESRT